MNDAVARACDALDDAVARGAIPGAVLAAGVGAGPPAILHVAGRAQDDAEARRPMTADTIFDLSSLTKVAATLPCVLRLVAAGELGLDDPARRYLAGFTGAGASCAPRSPGARSTSSRGKRCSARSA